MLRKDPTSGTVQRFKTLEKKDVSVKFFIDQLSPASDIDFAAERFRNASGSGPIDIRRAIETAIGLAEA
jgi:hypothetical protein